MRKFEFCGKDSIPFHFLHKTIAVSVRQGESNCAVKRDPFHFLKKVRYIQAKSYCIIKSSEAHKIY